MEWLVIAVLFLFLLTVRIMSARQKLAGMDENINHAMNQIGVLISSQFDVLMSLLAIVKCYDANKAGILISEMNSRRSMVTAESGPEDVISQERVISEILEKIIRIAECRPGLRENKEFVRYMDAIDCYERMIVTSRLIYNDSVTKFNSVALLFPMSLAVRMLGFRRRGCLDFTEDRVKF